MRCVVLIKQVPDTKNITTDTMKDDGTVNRAALPAIFNPDDLCALELALQMRDRYGGSVHVLTMGPPRAGDILKDSLCRGADGVTLISGRGFAAADTLATSYTLSRAIDKLGKFDLIFCGRQAIDGDTAQVGPQVAEKMKLPQATYAIDAWLEEETFFVKREVEGGYEVVTLPLPGLISVTGGYVLPRPKSAKRVIRYRKAESIFDITTRLKKDYPEKNEEEINAFVDQEIKRLQQQGLLIPVWGMEDLNVETERVGIAGSPTRVWRVQKVTLHTGESKVIEPTEEGLQSLMQELMEDHVLG